MTSNISDDDLDRDQAIPRDTGIKNANELLVYTAGTETGGAGGNFSAINFSTRFGRRNRP